MLQLIAPSLLLTHQGPSVARLGTAMKDTIARASTPAAMRTHMINPPNDRRAATHKIAMFHDAAVPPGNWPWRSRGHRLQFSHSD